MKVEFECSNADFKVRGYYNDENEKKGLCWIDENGNDRGNSFPRNPFNPDDEEYVKWKSFRDAILLNYHVILDSVKQYKGEENVRINHWYYLLKIN